jgi:hypothetical protein
VPISLAAVAVHTGAMLAVTAAMAGVVYEWMGLALLRRGWINLDRIWIYAADILRQWTIAARLLAYSLSMRARWRWDCIRGRHLAWEIGVGV